MYVIQIDSKITDKLSLKIEGYFQRAGISHDSASSLKKACLERLNNDGPDAFMLTVRSCCEELHLKLSCILDEILEEIDEETIQ